VIVAATRDGHTLPRVVPGFTKQAVPDYATGNIEAGARAHRWTRLLQRLRRGRMKHVIKITGGGRPTGGDFKCVNTGLGKVKGAITGTCRSIDIRHTPRYLAGYEWRYNRRFVLPKNLERPADFAGTVASKPHREIAAVRPNREAETPG
jgi:hypothetical protein